jgi:UDP-N-acetylglucosamine 1-carboxyvinyltransferase
MSPGWASLAVSSGTHAAPSLAGPVDTWVVCGGREFTDVAIPIQGHKHSAVPLIAGAMGMGVKLHLSNIPDVEDIRVLTRVLANAGAEVSAADDQVIFDFQNMSAPRLSPSTMAAAHGTLYLVPATIARFGGADFSEAGGCQIGDAATDGRRPFRHVLDVLSSFGATFTRTTSGRIRGSSEGLRGCTIDAAAFSGPPGREGPLRSGATKTALIASAVAKGQTTIKNPYPKPDAVELARYLRASGLAVSLGQREIRVFSGGNHSATQARLPPDFSEVMTWVALSVCSGRSLRLGRVNMDDLRSGLAAELVLLDRMGVIVDGEGEDLVILPPLTVSPVEVHASPDGLSSDHQPLFAVMLLKATGESLVTDSVWPDRFHYIDGLRAMGADIERRDSAICIRPVAALHPPAGSLHGQDVRATAALVVAAATLDAPVTLTGVQHLRRGYDDLPGKLRSLGVCVA